MRKVKQLINTYYEEDLKESFYQSEIAKRLEKQQNTSDIDWEIIFYLYRQLTQQYYQEAKWCTNLESKIK
ncbi:hypothetical protein AAZX31_18G103700 [Glycine max]